MGMIRRTDADHHKSRHELLFPEKLLFWFSHNRTDVSKKNIKLNRVLLKEKKIPRSDKETFDSLLTQLPTRYFMPKLLAENKCC